MDKRFFVIAIAVCTAIGATLLQLFMQGRTADPRQKRLLWVSLVAGGVGLLVLAMILLGHE